jgi:hypothetical protein
MLGVRGSAYTGIFSLVLFDKHELLSAGLRIQRNWSMVTLLLPCVVLLTLFLDVLGRLQTSLSRVIVTTICVSIFSLFGLPMKPFDRGLHLSFI